MKFTKKCSQECSWQHYSEQSKTGNNSDVFQKFRRDKKQDGITTMELYKPLKINKPLKHIAQGISLIDPKIRYYVIM